MNIVAILGLGDFLGCFRLFGFGYRLILDLRLVFTLSCGLGFIRLLGISEQSLTECIRKGFLV